jgi:hypothetical protein|nr:MAG TPA: Endonuclease [Caudoviricetes sp.]
MRKRKYFARKVETPYGKFDSQKEYERFLYLKSEENKGIIHDLQRQISFEIIPKLTKVIPKQLKTKIKYIERVEEQAAKYTPDFCYHNHSGNFIIEEVKSEGTALARDYPLRRKLLKQIIAKHNKEVGYEDWIFNEVK